MPVPFEFCHMALSRSFTCWVANGKLIAILAPTPHLSNVQTIEFRLALRIKAAGSHDLFF